jgi:hypothetical protein
MSIYYYYYCFREIIEVVLKGFLVPLSVSLLLLLRGVGFSHGL